MNIPFLTIENELGIFFAEQLNLTIADNFFIGKLPESCIDCCAMLLTPQSNKNSQLPTYSLQIVGRYTTRANAAEVLNILRGLSPYYAAKYVLFASGGSDIFMTSNRGKDCFGLSANFELKINVDAWTKDITN